MLGGIALRRGSCSGCLKGVAEEGFIAGRTAVQRKGWGRRSDMNGHKRLKKQKKG